MDFRKLLYLQFALIAVLTAFLGLFAFMAMLLDFQFPGTFRQWYFLRGGMPGNLALLIVFGLQHSGMARTSFKQAMRRFIPQELERSFYVMFSGFVLACLALLWSPSSPPIYDFRGTMLGYGLTGMALLSLPIIALALQAVDALDLAGIRSLIRIWKAEPIRPEPLKTPKIYKLVRHPLYLGMLLLIWFTPAMTHDHLFFAEVMTVYLLIGMQLEETDLVKKYGKSYQAYQAEVPMIIPFLKFPRRR